MGNKHSTFLSIHDERQRNEPQLLSMKTKESEKNKKKLYEKIEKNKKKLYEKIVYFYRKGHQKFVLHWSDIKLSTKNIQDVCDNVNAQYDNIVKFLPPNRVNNYYVFLLGHFSSSETYSD